MGSQIAIQLFFVTIQVSLLSRRLRRLYEGIPGGLQGPLESPAENHCWLRGPAPETGGVLPGYDAWQRSRGAIYQAPWGKDGAGDARRHAQDEILPCVSWSSAGHMPVVCLGEVVRP